MQSSFVFVKVNISAHLVDDLLPLNGFFWEHWNLSFKESFREFIVHVLFDFPSNHGCGSFNLFLHWLAVALSIGYLSAQKFQYILW